MALYNYKCVLCKRIKKILINEAPPEYINCNLPDCTKSGVPLGIAYREYSPATSQNVEILDNGFSAKPVERYSDAERLFKERADKHTLENQENGSDTHS